MLEMNKEYTYSQICEIVGWEKKAGNSKTAQINELESAYEFYHPMNKKTHMEKKSYIFTKQLRDLVEPSRENNGGGNNNKNISPMMDYLVGFLEEEDLYFYHSFTTWYCDILRLLNKGICNAPYNEKMEVETFCKEKSINNAKLFCEYVSAAKAILKNIFLKALEHMKKKNLVEYSDGYMFTYALGKRSLGHFETDELNEIILENEMNICNAMNEEFKLSKKLKGRQNLLVIYGDEDLQVEFTERKIDMIMRSQESLEICNRIIRQDDNHFGDVPVSEITPLLSYYRGIYISDIEFEEKDNIQELGIEICNIIRKKTRKQLLSKKYVNKYTGEIIYPYENCETDILAIEKLLFNYFDSDMVVTTLWSKPDSGRQLKIACGGTGTSDFHLQNDDTSDIDELFDGKSLWGESDPMENNYTVEEIMDMPTMSDVAV